MAKPKFGSFTSRQVQRMRGRLGAKLRQEAGITTRGAPKPIRDPGTAANRAEDGFNRRMTQAANAKTPEKVAAARDQAHAALSKYHEKTVSAGKQAKAEQARLAKVTAVLSPKQIEDAGYSQTGGRLKTQTRIERRGGKRVRVETKTREGRDRAALRRAHGKNWITRAEHGRLQRQAADKEARHTAMKKKYAKMYREYSGKGGRAHQKAPPPK